MGVNQQKMVIEWELTNKNGDLRGRTMVLKPPEFNPSDHGYIYITI